MRYFITGGTGFIGAYLVRDLLQAGHEVSVYEIAPQSGFLEEIAGSAVIAIGLKGIDSGPYWDHILVAMERWDLFDGAIKSLTFGGAIGLIACYKGFTCGHGAEGVGRACTQSFVASFIMVLVLDFFLTVILNAIYVSIWGFKPFLAG